MLLKWLDAKEAIEIGTSLADSFTVAHAGASDAAGRSAKRLKSFDQALREFFQRAQRETHSLQLNFYKKAKLANSFKWRLLEKGIDSQVAAEVTQALVTNLSMSRLSAGPRQPVNAMDAEPQSARRAPEILLRANQAIERSDVQGAAEALLEYLRIKPRDAAALNNLGVALSKLGRYAEAEKTFRDSIGIKPHHPEAHCKLGALLRDRGNLRDSEASLRRALKLNANHVDARVGLALTLLALGRPMDARPHLERALKAQPSNQAALLGMGQIASSEGDFSEAEATYRGVIEINPDELSAWAALATLRKMTSSDGAWLKRAEELAKGNITPPEEANLRFAMGKYCDDIADYPKAFQHYKRAKELSKATTESYNPEAHKRFVDDLIKVYTPECIEQLRQARPPADSDRPVFIVGMPRSGTSLVEQIVASHPSAVGAGELSFWTEVVHRHEAEIRRAPMKESLRRHFADGYLRLLAKHSATALRVVDKTPLNSDYLGLIFSTFPNARIIYMRRHPIDSCLSCYFQQFTSALNFTMDLESLDGYFRQHHRLVSHWRAVLPASTFLDVPYADLVVNQERWTRKILGFVGLEWNDQCLDFHNTRRMVATASVWQVRQKIYTNSIERWRNYEKFIGPLKQLESLDW